MARSWRVRSITVVLHRGTRGSVSEDSRRSVSGSVGSISPRAVVSGSMYELLSNGGLQLTAVGAHWCHTGACARWGQDRPDLAPTDDVRPPSSPQEPPWQSRDDQCCSARRPEAQRWPRPTEHTGSAPTG